jgi:hypothetical protein
MCVQVLFLGVALVAGRASARADVLGVPIGPGLPAAAAPVGEESAARETPVAASASPESKPLGGTREVRKDATKRDAVARGATDAKTGATREGSAFSGVTGPLVAVLGIIGILAGLATLVLRKRGGLGARFGVGGRAPAGILEVLGRYPLSRSQTLVLLKFDRRVLLLSQAKVGRLGATQLSTLCELTEPEDVASILTKVNEADENSLTSRFSSVFRALDREAVEKIERADLPVIRVAERETETLSRRSAPVLLPQSRSVPQRAEMTGAQAAASIRSRLQAIRVGTGAGGAA